MKKSLLLLPVFILLCAFSSIAQPPGGGQGQFMEMQKQRLKDSLGLTDVQIDTVMAVQQEFQPRTRDIRRDENMSDADKDAKLKAINVEKHIRLAVALKSEALATKIDEFNARMMQQMRGGGNRPPRGNN